MSYTFGQRPGDEVADSAGNVLSGISIGYFASKSDAVAGISVLTTVASDAKGYYPYVHPTLPLLWVRDPAGRVWSVISDEIAGEIPAIVASVTAETSRAQAAEAANATSIATNATNISNETAAAAKKAANLSDLASPSTARTNLGLGNVDNTSDLNKPVSTATATALSLKLDVTAAPQSANLPARFLAKMKAGTAVKVTCLGDSVLQGTTAGTPGTDDALSLFCTSMASKFGVTVTKSNLALGGRTVWQEKVDKWAQALTDNADLYVIAMTGKNDGAWDNNIFPQGGYERNASLAHIESMIRELKVSKPTADIMIVSGNPYGTATGSNIYNTNQKAYSLGLLNLAAYYGLPYADGWNLTPRAAGYTDAADPTYLYEASPNGVHPNSAGHAIIGNAMIALCPASFTATRAPSAALLPAAPPTGSLYPIRQSTAGVKLFTTATTTASIDRLINPSFTGAGWTAGGTGPWTSSTAGNFVYFMAKGTDFFGQFTFGAGQGTVDFHVDGKLVATAVDLSTYSAGKWMAIGTGLTPGVHNIRVVVNTGTVTIQQFGVVASAAEFVPITSTRIATTNLGAADNTNEWYGSVSYNSTATTTVSLDFVGTGILFQGRAPTTGSPAVYFTSVNLDGTNLASTPTWPANMLNEVGNIALPGLTGLPYAKHTVTFTYSAIGLYTGGFSIIDEQPQNHPLICEGVAVVGEAVKFPFLWTDTPTVIVSTTTANAAGAVSVTPTGFTVTGTGTDKVRWRAVASVQRGVY